MIALAVVLALGCNQTPIPPGPPGKLTVTAPKLAVTFYQDSAKEWRGNIAHWNGNILWKSSEGYKNKADCITAMTNLFAAIQHPSKDIERQNEYSQVTEKDVKGEWRSKIIHRNGNILWETSEGYKNQDDLVTAANNMFDAIRLGNYQIVGE